MVSLLRRDTPPINEDFKQRSLGGPATPSSCITRTELRGEAHYFLQPNDLLFFIDTLFCLLAFLYFFYFCIFLFLFVLLFYCLLALLFFYFSPFYFLLGTGVELNPVASVTVLLIETMFFVERV